MSNRRPDLGKLVSVHGTSPVFLQRAAIVAAVSFLFFLAALLFFRMQRSIGYFILSSAFLVVYVFTMIGWVIQKRNTVTVYENGLTYKKFTSSWNDLKSVRSDSGSGITLVKNDGESITIGRTVAEVEKIAVAIRKHLK
jgi:hypothetical protein